MGKISLYRKTVTYMSTQSIAPWVFFPCVPSLLAMGHARKSSNGFQSLWGLSVSLLRCCDTALVNAWHLDVFVTDCRSYMPLSISVYSHREAISMSACHWWKFWGMCVRKKAEKKIEMWYLGSPRALVTFQRCWIPSKMKKRKKMVLTKVC